jgi:hypothetical protein
MNSPSSGRTVHLVGSVPLASADAVFEVVGSILGPLVKRIPDGETGQRLKWIGYQGQRMKSVRGLELIQEIPVFSGPVPQSFPLFGLKAGVAPASLQFNPLGYAEAARSSYAAFRRQRDAGRLAHGTRFQVSLPTPTVVIFAFLHPRHYYEVLPVYEEAMKGELNEIVQAIPHQDLAIQWDIAGETEMSESTEWLRHFGPAVHELGCKLTREEMMATVARMVDAVPSGVEVGIHFCYGDPEGQHLVQPKDTSVVTDLANRVIGKIHRSLEWIHLPVPIDRDDQAYFAPLAGLRKPAATEIYLGLVHLDDGIEGARRRLAAATRVLSSFGIACECGLGRKPPERIPELLRLHREIARA